jgi:serine/threonine protein kinase
MYDRCANVLIAKRGDVKLCDFGLAALLTKDEPLRNDLVGRIVFE